MLKQFWKMSDCRARFDAPPLPPSLSYFRFTNYDWRYEVDQSFYPPVNLSFNIRWATIPPPEFNLN
jgi:hypothetical protein